MLASFIEQIFELGSRVCEKIRKNSHIWIKKKICNNCTLSLLHYTIDYNYNYKKYLGNSQSRKLLFNQFIINFFFNSDFNNNIASYNIAITAVISLLICQLNVNQLCIAYSSWLFTAILLHNIVWFQFFYYLCLYIHEF